MADDDKQIPFEQRKSQNLTFKDYAKDTLLWAALPILTGALTFIGGRISRNHFNNKIWPLDGSPTMFYTMYEKAFKHVGEKVAGEKLVIDEVQRLDPYNRIVPEAQRLNFTRDIWNFMKGTEIALFPTAFHFWKREERTRLNLKPAHDRLKVISASVPTDEELKADNASLREQLAHVEKKSGVGAPFTALAGGSVHHDGVLADGVARER